jgi:hypothetical protein
MLPLHFSSIDYARIKGRGDRVVVLCDLDRPRGTADLLNRAIDIDGALYIVLEIDNPDPSKAVRRGEQVALWVKPADAPVTDARGGSTDG